MSFSDYLKNRETAMSTALDSLKKDVFTESKDEDNIWKPKMGSDNTGYAVVRFLPGSDVTKTPWIKIFDHGFQGPTGKWYIENSLTTLGQKDPVGEYNSKLWNNGTEAGKEQARKQKRRTSYYANVLVIKDPNNPENEGKVKVFKFGQKIFEKVMGAMQPEFADEDPVNPFDLFEGANFRIKIKMVGGYWNYDNSDFEKPGPLSEDESRLEQIFNAQHDIYDMIAPDKFKSYEELEEKLNTVLGATSAPAPQPAYAAPATSPAQDDFAAAFEEKTSIPTATTSSSDDDDDLEAYFKSLATD